MENEVQIFDNAEFGKVRTVMIDNEPYFVGKDVVDILGYQNGSRDINTHVDEEDRLKYQISTAGQMREQTIINESGLFSLVLSSKLPAARRFKHWVTSEVLPAIRRTGSYGTPYVLIPKFYQSHFVITTADAAALLGVARESISQIVNQPLAKCKALKDYYLLQGQELACFKADNPSVSELASSVLVLLESGFKKVCSYLKVKMPAAFPKSFKPAQQTSLPIQTSNGTSHVPVLPIRQSTETRTDVPDNPGIQEWLQRIHKQKNALDELLRLFNRYNPPEGQKSLAYSLKSVTAELMASVYAMKEIPWNLVEKHI